MYMCIHVYYVDGHTYTHTYTHTHTHTAPPASQTDWASLLPPVSTIPANSHPPTAELTPPTPSRCLRQAPPTWPCGDFTRTLNPPHPLSHTDYMCQLSVYNIKEFVVQCMSVLCSFVTYYYCLAFLLKTIFVYKINNKFHVQNLIAHDMTYCAQKAKDVYNYIRIQL